MSCWYILEICQSWFLEIYDGLDVLADLIMDV